MASSEYWEKEKNKLLDLENGAHQVLSHDPRTLLNGSAMHGALEDVVKLRVLGLKSEATPMLSHILAGLRPLLESKLICDELRNPTERHPPSLIFHLRTLSIAHWLSTGGYDHGVLSRIIDEIRIDPEFTLKSTYSGFATNALICAAQYGDRATVENFYIRWEKNPLSSLPASQRFASNPRHVIYLHSLYGSEESARASLKESLDRLSIRARNWEKYDAVPYFDILDLAQTIFVCESMRGNQLALDEIWPMLR